MRFHASRNWAGAAAVLTMTLAACAADEPAPGPEPEPEPEVVATTPVALTTTLRYCLAPELGEAAPTVATLVAALPDMPGDGTVELVHVPEADADCRFDNPDIDLAVASWKADGGCTTTTEDLACMVRTLLVDLDDLGESTADVADTQVATDLRMHLDYMIAMAPSAPPVIGSPPAAQQSAGCTATIGSITPAMPTSYQSAALTGVYSLGSGCSLPFFVWSSDLDGIFSVSPFQPNAHHQFSPGSHTIYFDVTVLCPDPNDPSTQVLMTCGDSTTLDVAQGVLAPGDYCGRSADWWMTEEQAGNVHIQDESATSTIPLYGTNQQDLLIGNDWPNRGNGKRIGDCIIGNGNDDDLRGGFGADTMFGNDGRDTLVGNDDQDVISGGRGDDVVGGGLGGDLINGDDGNDKLDGSFDSDTIYGGNGADRVLGGNEDDYLSGGDGNDCVHGNFGDDRMFGDGGVDNLDGDDGNDDLSGGDGDDVLHGGMNGDLVHGNNGNDSLYGGAGPDNLFGDDGDDGLCGGTGSDNKDGGNHVNGDKCQLGGSNNNCESIPPLCPLPIYVTC